MQYSAQFYQITLAQFFRPSRASKAADRRPAYQLMFLFSSLLQLLPDYNRGSREVGNLLMVSVCLLRSWT